MNNINRHQRASTSKVTFEKGVPPSTPLFYDPIQQFSLKIADKKQKQDVIEEEIEK